MPSSSTLRVKVEWHGQQQRDNPSIKFVYVIRSPASTTIRMLIAALQEQLSEEFALRHIRLMQLTTNDGYILMNEDVCSDVLLNDDKLVCVDMHRFIVDSGDAIDINDPWLTLEHHDSTDDCEKRVQVGMTNTGKLGISLIGEGYNREVHLFSISELISLARSDKKGNKSRSIRCQRHH